MTAEEQCSARAILYNWDYYCAHPEYLDPCWHNFMDQWLEEYVNARNYYNPEWKKDDPYADDYGMDGTLLITYLVSGRREH